MYCTQCFIEEFKATDHNPYKKHNKKSPKYSVLKMNDITFSLKHNVLCLKPLSQLIEIEFFGGVYVGDKRLLNKTSSTQEAIVK